MIEDQNDKTHAAEETDHNEVFSKAVRAGKRTYFFDVKATRKNDYFLTITESKKRFHKDGRFYFEKHKIFIYKEDFDKFTNGYLEVLDYVKSLRLSDNVVESIKNNGDTEDYSNIEFEDLESLELEDRKLEN